VGCRIMNLSISVLFALGLCASPDCSEPSPSFTLQAKKDDKKDKEKKRKPGFTISKETTYVTGPLDKDGYIDYETALNERLREGVTPENNANVLLWKAFGPYPGGVKAAAEVFAWMKVPVPPEKGDYFVNLDQFMKDHLKVDPSKESDKFYEEIDKVTTRPWTVKEHPQIAAWIKLNEKPLALAHEASRRSHFFNPLIADRKNGKSQGLMTASVVGAQQCRGVATALTARAMLRVGEKRYDDAWQDLLACHRLGRLVGRGGTLIEGLVGVAIDGIASRADLAFLDAGKLDANQLKKRLADLQDLPPMALMADKMNLTELFTFLETVMILDREGVGYLETLSTVQPDKEDPWGKLFTSVFLADIQWDTALCNINQTYNRMSTAMRLKDRGLRERHMELIEMDIRELKATLVNMDEIARTIVGAKNIAEGKGKYLGDMMICLLVPATRKVQYAADRTEQNQYNLHIAFALAAYKSDNGKYPRMLDALTPKYLTTVPQDLFSGKALIYRPSENGYLLYSVGVNGRDDDGRSFDDDPPGDDLPVRMPLPKPREQN
jgi:hypothetical protein